MEKTNYKYKFTVIMPVYNTEEYIEEAINSVINQDIGLKHVQLIIVNDGSTDESLKKARKYSSLYPNNIYIINKENGGPSSARNVGIEYIKGKYVNFMDSDDTISRDVLRKAYLFLDKNYSKTDLVSIPLVFFDGRTGEHHLNYKYKKGTRVIDLNEEWDTPQLHIASCYIKKSIFDKGFRFDERTSYAEDAKLVQQIISEKQTLGVISDAVYFYRIRKGTNKSAIQSSIENKKWYTSCLKYSYKDLIDFYIKKYSCIPKSVQNVICYDLQWKIKRTEIPNNILNNKEKQEYISLLKNILAEIDNDIIEYQKDIGKDIKIAMLELKGERTTRKTANNTNVIILNSSIIYSEEKDASLMLDFIRNNKETCTIEGRYCSIFNTTPKITLVENGKQYDSLIEKTISEGCIIKKETRYTYKFIIEFKMDKNHEYQFLIQYDNCCFQPQNIVYGQYFPLSLELKNMYCCLGEYILLRKDFNLCFYEYKIKKHIIFEIKFITELIKYNSKNELYNAIKKAIFVRLLVNIYKLFVSTQIWLFRDRTNVADDNGIVFYNYINNKIKNIKPVFALSSTSQNYRILKREGNVIDALSWKYKIVYLLSEYVFSSSGDNDAIRPFSGHNEPYKDLEHNVKRVFLQHGVIKDDLSAWLNKYEMDFAGFVCSSEKEKQSILKENYSYSSKEIWLTGLPRYDNLYDKREKLIAIAPTWRTYLIGEKDKNDHRELISGFLKSSYFQTYNSLLNDKKLFELLSKKGYKLVFFSHPTFKEHSDLFINCNNYIIEPDIKYSEIFSKASLLITDYSSVAFDFAYLKKPVLYFQFDEKEFFKNHDVYDRGYFSYLEDGFGEIEYQIEGLVNRIEEYLENDCKMKEIYKERVNNFFAFTDRSNCKRVLDKVFELEKNR